MFVGVVVYVIIIIWWWIFSSFFPGLIGEHEPRGSKEPK